MGLFMIKLNFYMEASCSKNVRSLIQSDVYESILVSVLSKSFFSNHHLVRNTPQSNGESDFTDLLNGYKYEAKLVFDEEQGRLLATSRENRDTVTDYSNFKKWVNSMIEEQKEIHPVSCNCTNLLRKSKLFCAMIDQLLKLKKEENAVLFFTFPFIEDFHNDIESLMFRSTIEKLYKECCKDVDRTGNLDFAVYPAIGDQVVVRRFCDWKTEPGHVLLMRNFINTNEISKYLSYDVGYYK